MANEQGQYKIKLVSEADLKGSREMQNAIDQTTVSVKGLEEATKKANAAAAQSPIATNTGGGLATSGDAARKANADRLKAEEREAGLRTERTMGAEDKEAALHKARIDAFKQEAEAKKITQVATEAVTGSLRSLALQAIRIVAAWKTIKAAFSETIPQWAEQEQNINKLNAALVNAGTFSAAFSGKLQNLAVEMQRSSGIGQEEWLQTFTKLAQFGADNSNIISLTNAVKNAAGIYGTLGQATTAVQKAMEGQFDTFREHGIVIDQNATQAEKLKQLFQELERVGGGQLQAEMMGLSGAWKEMSGNAHSLGQNMGRLITETFQLEDIVRGVALVFETWSDVTQRTAKEEGKFADSTHRATRSMQEQKDLARQLQIEMEKLKDGYTHAREAVHGMQAAMDSIEHAQSDTLKKRLDRDIKLIESMVQRRVITEQQGLIKKAQLEQRFEAAAEQRKEAAFLRESLRKDEELAASLMQEQVIQKEIEKVKSGATTRAKANAVERRAKNAEKDFAQEQLINQKIQDDLEKEKGSGGSLFGSETGPSDKQKRLEAELEASNQRLKLSEDLADKERAHAGATQDQFNNDKEKIKQLEDQLRSQQNSTTTRRFDAFNSAVTARSNVTQSRAGFNLDAQGRRIDLNDRLFQAGGGAPQTTRGPAEELRATIAERNAMMLDFSAAVREKRTADAKADIELVKLWGGTAAQVAAMEKAVKNIQSQQSNRHPGAGG